MQYRIRIFFSTILVILFLSVSNAKGPSLSQIHPNNLGMSSPSGYDILLDQLFRFKGGNFDGKTLFFADGSLGKKPAVFIGRDHKIIASRTLPEMEEGFHLVEVNAVSVDSKHTTEKNCRILAILRFEPPSGPRDAWDQAFVIDVHTDGDVFFEPSLNKKLSQKVNKIKTIKSLKSFLSGL